MISPNFSFPINKDVIFLANLKTLKSNTFFKLLKHLQSIIFALPNLYDLVRDKAIMVIISSVPISGCIAGTVSTTGTFSVGDLRNLEQSNHNCAKRLCKY